MDRLISEQKAIEAINDYWGEMETPTIDGYINAIKGIPSAEPKTGHWISMYTEKQSHTKDGMVSESVRCSECDEWLTASDEYACYGRFCPNCGARMESEDKE